MKPVTAQDQDPDPMVHHTSSSEERPDVLKIVNQLLNGEEVLSDEQNAAVMTALKVGFQVLAREDCGDSLIDAMNKMESGKLREEYFRAYFEVIRSREATYRNAESGRSAVDSHRRLGKIWTALIENYYGMQFPQDIPPELVFLMMAGNKLNRGAADPAGLDHAVDGSNYLRLAWEAKVSDES